MTEASATIPVAPSGTDESERETYRKAGRAYFEQVMATARNTAPSSGPPANGGASTQGADEPAAHLHTRSTVRRPVAGMPTAKDLEAMRSAVEQHRVALVTGSVLFCSCTTWILLRDALDYLPAPGTLCVLQMAATAAGAAFWGRRGVFPFASGLPSLHATQACVPAMAWTSLRLLAMCGLVWHCGVAFALASSAAAQFLPFVVLQHVLATPPLTPQNQTVGVGAVAVGMAVACLGISLPGPKGLFFLSLLLAADLAEAGWVRASSMGHTRLAHALGEHRAAVLRPLLDAQAEVDPGQVYLLAHSLPIVPVLALGLTFGEARTHSRAQHHIPGLTSIVVSMVCYAVMSTALFFLRHTGQRTRSTELALGVATATAVVLDQAGGSSYGLLAASGALVTVLGTTAAIHAK